MRVYLVIETSLLRVRLEEFIDQTVCAGVKIFQLRNKGADGKELFDKAVLIKNTLKPYGAKLIINDRADVAAASGADGVHLGPRDVPPDITARIYPDLIIGFSCNNVADALLASVHADYAGIGPFFPTSTKKDLRPLLSGSMASEITRVLSVPSVAIGGINPANIRTAVASGVSGAAVSSYVCSSERPYEAVKKLFEAVE